jgi:hypothetical protein
MNRCLAFLAALFMTIISVSSACTAQSTGPLRFSLEPGHGGDFVHASFRNSEDGRHNENSWSTDFAAADLVGLDPAGFRAAGTRPLHFALIRQAGRLDCSGQGGGLRGNGDCRFTADPAFAEMLRARGIGQPTGKQAFALMAVNAKRELVEALASANYPRPTIDDLIPLAALEVDSNYIRQLAQVGYRPKDLDTLVQFKALKVTPQWIGEVTRMGYANVPAGDLVQLRALDITPDFIAGFERIGYRHLPIDELVQLKALGVTPEYVERVSAMDGGSASVSKVVQAKALGIVR